MIDAESFEIRGERLFLTTARVENKPSRRVIHRRRKQRIFSA